ncbi:MAG: YceI family protein [Saprospiraceae bacterium]|nr:YceI family protein [Saprospiraceae bacterium]
MILVFGVFVIGFVPVVCGQQVVFQTVSGHIHFRSDAPMEMIEATSQATKGYLNAEDRTFAFSVPVNSFKGFNSALQQDHFNENYLESESFPQATFSGKIIESTDLSTPGVYDIRAKGKMVIHGIARERIIRCQLVIKPTVMLVNARFSVLLRDHQIQIPRIVHQKIAEEIQVDLAFKLSPR